ELVHHDVNGVLEFENFSLHVHRNFARQVAARHSSRNLCDVSNLTGKVTGHGIDRVSQVLPRASNAGHVGLSPEPALSSHFAGHTRNFAGKPVQLVHHRVQSFFQLQNFAAHIDRDFARQVTARNSSRNLGNVSHLSSEVAGHEVDVIC